MSSDEAIRHHRRLAWGLVPMAALAFFFSSQKAPPPSPREALCAALRACGLATEQVVLGPQGVQASPQAVACLEDVDWPRPPEDRALRCEAEAKAEAEGAGL